MRKCVIGCLFLAAGILSGCGTTRWTDSRRTATEQLLISDAVDRAVMEIDFTVMRGKDVYFDDSYLTGVVDQDYLISSLRQHLLASGCVLKEQRDDATYVVEARAGAVGTDRHDLLYGMPATTIPSFVPLPGMPSSLPEIPLAKRTNQTGVAKLAVFAYHRQSGRPVWQSGMSSQTSSAKDIWLFGAGPFQKGTIYDGTVFAGQKISNPLVRRTPDVDLDEMSRVRLTAEMTFPDPSPTVALRSPPPPPMAPDAVALPAGPPQHGNPTPPSPRGSASAGVATHQPLPALPPGPPAKERPPAPTAPPAPSTPRQPGTDQVGPRYR